MARKSTKRAPSVAQLQMQVDSIAGPAVIVPTEERVLSDCQIVPERAAPVEREPLADSEPFGRWLLAQRDRGDWIDELADAARQDRGFPTTPSGAGDLPPVGSGPCDHVGCSNNRSNASRYHIAVPLNGAHLFTIRLLTLQAKPHVDVVRFPSWGHETTSRARIAPIGPLMRNMDQGSNRGEA